MSTNGSTAIDFSGIVNEALAAGGAKFVGEVASAGAELTGGGRRRTHARTAKASTTTTAPISSSRFVRKVGFAALPVGGELAGGLDEATAAADGERPVFALNTLRTRSTNAAGVSPPGRRDHCTRMKDSGTSEPDSRVESMHTGTINVLVRAMRWVR